VLFVANFPSNTGYAWQHIESLFGKVADRLARRNIASFVAYPAIPEPPRSLAGSSARPVELDASLNSWSSLLQTVRFIRQHRTRVIYLTDRPPWQAAYMALRMVGVRHITVHDRTSGAHTPPRGLRRLVKWILVRSPFISADLVIAVSDFVRRRDLAVWLVPPNRIVTVHNGFPVAHSTAGGVGHTHRALGIPAERPIVACACRAAPEKGVQHLLRAFDMVLRRSDSDRRPVLVYLGDGPYLEELVQLRAELPSAPDIRLEGYRPEAMELLTDVDVLVVPSTWQDALPSAVLEPMARGMAVVASDVGGVPEMIEHGKSGILVPPGDEERLAAAIDELLADPGRRKQLGENARRRVAECFSPDGQLTAITELLDRALE
jgi:glycosyltransferase involved in cell wall biosynthesis